MKQNLLTFITSMVSMLSAAISANADGSGGRNRGQSACCEETRMMGAYNSSASYDVGGAWGFFFSADFLYWQAREDGLEYGVTSTSSTAFTSGKVLNMDFKWHPGVKIGLGMDFPCHDNWDIFAEWTHLVSHNNTSSSVSGLEVIFPSLLEPAFITTNTVTNARASWKLVYNTFDLNIGRPYYSGKLLTLRPHIGLRGSWFKQKYSATYLNGFTLFSWVDNTTFNSWGIGPRLGFDSNWMIGCGFRIFGNAAFSLLYTYFDVKKLEEEFITTGGTAALTASSFVENKKMNSQVRSNAEASLGFGWGSYFSNNCWYIDLSLGYEFQYWPDANKDLRFVDSSAAGVFVSGGNLALHGVTFKVRLDF